MIFIPVVSKCYVKIGVVFLNFLDKDLVPELLYGNGTGTNLMQRRADLIVYLLFQNLCMLGKIFLKKVRKCSILE
jgi:hypothetical protein